MYHEAEGSTGFWRRSVGSSRQAGEGHSEELEHPKEEPDRPGEALQPDQPVAGRPQRGVEAKFDFVAAPVTVTKERAENYLFTEGYLNTDYQFLTKKGEPAITDLKQLKGKVVSVNKGSAYDSWARGLEGEIGWTVESFGTQTDAVQAVMAGRAYANVAGNTAIQYAVKQQPQLQLSYLYSTGLVWSAALRKDSKELLGQIENAIECMKKDGTIAAMHERWFGIKPPPGSAAVTIFAGTGVPGMPGYDATPREPQCN